MIRHWFVATLALTMFAVGACAEPPAPAQPPEAISDKGTPFGDLLVPKLAANVTDGAIGVPVHSPVTISAEQGVLGMVNLVNDEGRPVAGE